MSGRHEDTKRLVREISADVGAKKIRRGEKVYAYFQLVEGYRDEQGKVRQRVLKHLGRFYSIDEAPTAAAKEDRAS